MTSYDSIISLLYVLIGLCAVIVLLLMDLKRSYKLPPSRPADDLKPISPGLFIAFGIAYLIHRSFREDTRQSHQKLWPFEKTQNDLVEPDQKD